MKRKHLPLGLVSLGLAMASAGLWLLCGPASVLVLLGGASIALGLLMEV